MHEKKASKIPLDEPKGIVGGSKEKEKERGGTTQKVGRRMTKKEEKVEQVAHRVGYWDRKELKIQLQPRRRLSRGSRDGRCAAGIENNEMNDEKT